MIKKIQETHSERFESEIPESWLMARFDDVVYVTDYVANGSFASLKQNVTYLVEPSYAILVRFTDYVKGWNGNYKYVDEHAYNFLSKSSVNPGDVIIANVGNPGKLFIVPNLGVPMTLGPNSVLVRPLDKNILATKYLAYFYQSAWGKDLIAQITTGTAQQKFNKTGLRSSYIPLAPPEQQKRIVAKIEELFSHIDAGIAALKKAKQLLKQYRQSVLKAAVTGELLGGVFSSALYKPINHGLETLGQGWSPKCNREPSPSEDVWGVIKTTAIQPLEYRQEENKRLPDKLEPRPHLEIMAGDVLVTRAGPRVRVGVCCLVKETRSKLIICDKAYRLRPNVEKILPEYLEIVLNAPQVQKEIESMKSGISDSGLNLTQKRFVELVIPYPSIDKQKQLIRLVYEKTESIARLENDIESQLNKSEKIKQSILASAFSGKLYE